MLKLSVEQKGALVPIGELTVYLDGLSVTDQEDLAPLTNGNAANGTSELSIYMSGVMVGFPPFTPTCNSGRQTMRKHKEIKWHRDMNADVKHWYLILVQLSYYHVFFVEMIDIVHNNSKLTFYLPSFTEVQQNGDTIHENGDTSSSSSRAANR